MRALKRGNRKLPVCPRPTRAQIDAARPGVLCGLKDLEEGRYADYDAAGLMQLAKDIVASSVRKYR
jgi:hypothetical protein